MTRNALYRLALTRFRRDPIRVSNRGLCYELGEIARNYGHNNDNGLHVDKELAPEFYLFEPEEKVMGLWWWDIGESGRNERETALLFMIQMTEP